MENSFVLNLNQNEQDITSSGTTIKQNGEFIIKGNAEHHVPSEGQQGNPEYDINVLIPPELFRYAANVLGVASADLSVYYNATHDLNHVYLIFTEGEGEPK